MFLKSLKEHSESFDADALARLGSTLVYHQHLEKMIDDYLDRYLNVENLEPLGLSFDKKLTLASSLKLPLNIFPAFQKMIREINTYRNKTSHHLLKKDFGFEILSDTKAFLDRFLTEEHKSEMLPEAYIMLFTHILSSAYDKKIQRFNEFQEETLELRQLIEDYSNEWAASVKSDLFKIKL